MKLLFLLVLILFIFKPEAIISVFEVALDILGVVVGLIVYVPFLLLLFALF